jgi:hypothetical protein
MEPIGHFQADRLGQAGRLVEARGDVAPAVAAQLGQCDDGAGAAADVTA